MGQVGKLSKYYMQIDDPVLVTETRAHLQHIVKTLQEVNKFNYLGVMISTDDGMGGGSG